MMKTNLDCEELEALASQLVRLLGRNSFLIRHGARSIDYFIRSSGLASRSLEGAGGGGIRVRKYIVNARSARLPLPITLSLHYIAR